MLASQRHLRHIVFKETRIEPANRGKYSLLLHFLTFNSACLPSYSIYTTIRINLVDLVVFVLFFVRLCV